VSPRLTIFNSNLYDTPPPDGLSNLIPADARVSKRKRFPPLHTAGIRRPGLLWRGLCRKKIHPPPLPLAPAGAVGGGSYALSTCGLQLLPVPKYYIVAKALVSSPLTPRRRDASCFLTLFVAVWTAGAFRFIRAMPYLYAG